MDGSDDFACMGMLVCLSQLESSHSSVGRVLVDITASVESEVFLIVFGLTGSGGGRSTTAGQVSWTFGEGPPSD